MVSEKTLSTAAIIISTFALIVSIWQAKDSRDFNELSIKPHLQINPKLTGDKESGLYLENAGTGTAFIESLSLTANGKTFDLIKNNSSEFFNSINVKPNCYRESWPRKGAAIQSGKEFPLIKVTEANAPLCNFEAMKFLAEPNLIMNISYMTPYNEVITLSENISLTKRELGIYFDFINKFKNITRR